MTRYDTLDPRTELEQAITQELDRALGKRGFTVHHNGTAAINAPGDTPDIIAFDNNTYINIEVTKTTKSGANREFLAIKDHLQKAKKENARKNCFVMYVSPETDYRMINAIMDFNILNNAQADMKMIPIRFSTFELLTDRLITSHPDQYPRKQLLSIFDEYKSFVDDERILGIIHSKLFADDKELKREIAVQEENKHQKIVEELIQTLLDLEDDLRENKGISHIDAIRNIIFLVFIKLYEEKRGFEEDKENRFKVETFKKYQELVGQDREKKAIHQLFNTIKKDRELVDAKVFTEGDVLSEKLDDDFVIKFFIEPFEKYIFYKRKIDGIGSAYEVLGMRTGKDVKAGQFFTPENVVNFMMLMAELETDDVILDPACGTARFLIYSMRHMIEHVSGKNADDQKAHIRKQQLFGSDYDPNVAKLAKMNIYIHGDGKSNIFAKDGLLLSEMDEKIDVILTNPPLGDQSYHKIDYDEDFKLKRMEVIPKLNVTQEKLDKCKDKLAELEQSSFSGTSSVKAKRIEKSIKHYKQTISELEADMRAGRAEWKVTGNQMKGGALFINAAKHYLKSVRDKNLPIEWRGGKLLIILDEGILNTDDYVDLREFLRKYFYIKAIISLSRDTFVPVSNTTTKTSILYAIKKEDPDATQKEPVFFAHAEKVGVDTRGRVCANHLFDSGNDILFKFSEFKRKVFDSYVGLEFSKQKFEKQKFAAGTLENPERVLSNHQNNGKLNGNGSRSKI